MPQIGNHTYSETSDPIPSGTAQAGTHGYVVTDNRDDPCNGLASCDTCTPEEGTQS